MRVQQVSAPLKWDKKASYCNTTKGLSMDFSVSHKVSALTRDKSVCIQYMYIGQWVSLSKEAPVKGCMLLANIIIISLSLIK